MKDNFSEWLIVIPARLASTRLEEKALKDLCGKPMIARVCESVKKLEIFGATVVVATDHDRIASAALVEGLQSVMTDSNIQTGTDRVFQASQKFPQKKWIMNVQGDEPFIHSEDLLELMKQFQNQNACTIGTLAKRSTDVEHLLNPNVVKAVVNRFGKALYFSRSPIPFDRSTQKPASDFWHHMGVYCFSKDSLEKFCSAQQSSLEKLESLEQLRAFELGLDILVVEAKVLSQGIDTPQDLEQARNKLKTMLESHSS